MNDIIILCTIQTSVFFLIVLNAMIDSLIDRLTDFNGISTCLELSYA